MTQGYQLDQLLSLRLLKPFFNNVLLELGGLPHVFPLALTWNDLGHPPDRGTKGIYLYYVGTLRPSKSYGWVVVAQKIFVFLGPGLWTENWPWACQYKEIRRQ